MARNEPKRRRPTANQIVKIQDRIIGYLAKSGQPIDVAARTFNASQKELESFLFNPVDRTRKAFNRSPAVKRIYDATKPKGPIGAIKRVPRIRSSEPYVDSNGEIRERIYIRGVSEEARRRASILAHASRMEFRTTEAKATLEWQIWSSEQGTPTSLVDIKNRLQEGSLSSSQVSGILSHWRKVYSINEDYFVSVAEEMDIEYEPEFDEL